MGNNSVPVLATLFLISYSKLYRTIIKALNWSTIMISTLQNSEAVWSSDGNLDYLGVRIMDIELCLVKSYDTWLGDVCTCSVLVHVLVVVMYSYMYMYMCMHSYLYMYMCMYMYKYM